MPPTTPRPRKKPPKQAAGSGNQLIPKRDRRKKHEGRMARSLYDGRENAWHMDLEMVPRIITGILLLPLSILTTAAVFSCFADSLEASFWRTSQFWFFSLGFIMWTIAFYALPRPVWLYVLGHEFTHALFAFCSGGKIHDFKVTRKGGHVITDKSNWLISLSPYFVPIYALAVAMLAWLVGLKVDLGSFRSIGIPGFEGFRWMWGVFWLLGASWGFHATFTVWMIARDQPDLRTNGTFLSLNIIYLANILLAALLLVLASPEISPHEFATRWWEIAQRGLRTVGQFLRAASSLVGES